MADLARTKSERDAAIAALDKRGRRDRRRARWRRLLVGFLVVVFAVLVPVTVTLGWAHYTVLNSKGFQKAVGPLVTNPAVTSAVATEVTNQIFTALDAEGQVAAALPPKASFLAGPITNGAKGYVQNGVTKVLESSQFQKLWEQATAFAHTQLVSVLEGKSTTVTTTNGEVVLNLVPLLNDSLQNIQGFASGLVGRPIKLPTISANEVPAAACQKIATALDRPVPATCGQIPLFPADKLVQAQRAVRAFNRILVLLLIVTPVTGALALWLSRRHRRTLLQLSVGAILGLVVARRATSWLQTTLVNTGRPAYKDFRHAVMTQVLSGFFDITRLLLIGLLVVLAVSLVTGPYPWARALRLKVSSIARAGANLVVATVGKARDDATIGWVRSHLDLLRVAGVGLAILLVVVISVSFIGFLIIAALLAAYEIALGRLAHSTRATQSASPPPPSPPPVTP